MNEQLVREAIALLQWAAVSPNHSNADNVRTVAGTSAVIHRSEG